MKIPKRSRSVGCVCQESTRLMNQYCFLIIKNMYTTVQILLSLTVCCYRHKWPCALGIVVSCLHLLFPALHSGEQTVSAPAAVIGGSRGERSGHMPPLTSNIRCSHAAPQCAPLPLPRLALVLANVLALAQMVPPVQVSLPVVNADSGRGRGGGALCR